MVKIQKIRVYYGSPGQIWTTLQAYYEMHEGEQYKAYVLKHMYYCNSIYTLFIQMELFPDRRSELLNSLLSYIYGKGNADGLESALISLIHAAHIDENAELATAGLKTWKKLATKPTVPGSGPFMFYNVATKSLSYLGAQFALEFIKAAPLTDLDAVAKRLQAASLDTAVNPFRGPSSGDIQWLGPGTALPQGGGGLHRRFFTKSERAQMNFAAQSAAWVGAFAGVIPGGQPAAGFCAGYAATLKLIVSIDEAFGTEVPEKPKPTSELDHIDKEDPELPDVPIEVAVSSPGMDESGIEGGLGEEGEGEDGGIFSGDDGGGCFVAATPVLMADGSLKPIGDVQAGDLVQSHFETGNIQARVTKKHQACVPETLDVRLDDGTVLTTTPKQRFAVTHSSSVSCAAPSRISKDDAMFVEAQQLTQSTELRSADDVSLHVVERRGVVHGQFEVFNLTVEKGHTYFVGPKRVLVHNRKDADDGPDDPWGLA